MRGRMQVSASGLQTARMALDAHAHAIANLAAEGPGGQPLVDLPTEVVGLITSELMYGANARMLRTQAETQRTLLDVLA